MVDRDEPTEATHQLAGVDQGCPFCAIAAGRDTAVEVVCRSEEWIAFFPDAPATLGHTLVIPRSHVRHLWAADAKLGAVLMDAVVRVGNAVMSALNPDGMNLISSAGLAAQQTVTHLHLHVVPRWFDDAIDPIWPPKEFVPRRLTREAADLIRGELAGMTGTK
jgi:histidine triad (HIT) family protein